MIPLGFIAGAGRHTATTILHTQQQCVPLLLLCRLPVKRPDIADLRLRLRLRLVIVVLIMVAIMRITILARHRRLMDLSTRGVLAQGQIRGLGLLIDDAAFRLDLEDV